MFFSAKELAFSSISGDGQVKLKNGMVVKFVKFEPLDSYKIGASCRKQ